MSCNALVRPLRAIAWELRAAWATGHRISLTIDGDVDRVEGHVRTISATDAFVIVAGLHVPLDRILAVHKPSLLGDSTYRGEHWSGQVPAAARRNPRQLELGASL